MQKNKLLALTFLFQNDGARPASEISFSLNSYPFNEVLDTVENNGSAIFKINSKFEMSADLPRNQSTPWYFENLKLSMTQSQYYY